MAGAKKPQGHVKGPFCDSPRSKGKPGTCKRPAGWGTEHVGEGRCKMHGGNTPIKHGRYSKINRPRIAALLLEMESDPDPLDLLPEVKLLRSLILDYIERFDEFKEALFTWHIAKTGRPPREPMDILSIGAFVGQIGGLVDKIGKQKAEGSITLETLDRVMEQFGSELVAAAQETITDVAQRAALLESVERRWGSVRLEPKPRRKGPKEGEGEG